MTESGDGLAGRLKAAIERRRREADAAREDERLSQERNRQRVSELLQRLESFGKAVGYFDIARRRDALSLSWEGRSLTFIPNGDAGTVEVTGDNLPSRSLLEYQHELERWVWVRQDRFQRRQATLLFDAGLEALVAQALGVPLE